MTISHEPLVDYTPHLPLGVIVTERSQQQHWRLRWRDKVLDALTEPEADLTDTPAWTNVYDDGYEAGYRAGHEIGTNEATSV